MTTDAAIDFPPVKLGKDAVIKCAFEARIS
jgi:hypothetical protein